MKIETLKKSHLKRNIIIGVVAVLIISVVILNFTRAKYRTTQSIPLVNGTINYKPYDFKLIAMYKESETGEYVEIEQIPNNGYTINIDKSYCEVNNEIDTSIPINYENGRVFIGVNTAGTKCYLYFVEKEQTIQDLPDNYATQLTRNNFSQIVTNATTGTIYYADTSKGRTYYFAGNPTDNWVKFAGYYWRIIRINENGSLRVIYQGTSTNILGSDTHIGTSTFNSSYNDNAYVGFKYTTNNVHGIGTNSNILEVLNVWYQNNLKDYADKIDINAGFCNDRTPYSGNGLGTSATSYKAYYRLVNNKAPSFECNNNNDLFTTSGSVDGNKALQYPIGLITIDEVAYAGGVNNVNNTNYYLYTNQDYWTITPSLYDANGAVLFYIDSTGDINIFGRVIGQRNIRPVINLRADIELTGSGTATDPYQLVM